MARPVAVCVMRNLPFPAPLAGPVASASAIRFNTGNLVQAAAASLDAPATAHQANTHAQNHQEKDHEAEENLDHG